MSRSHQSRRSLLQLTAVLAFSMPFLPALAATAPRTRITDVRVRSLRVIQEIGTYPDWVGGTRVSRIGGGTITEIHTDQGVSGMGPGVAENLLPRIHSLLVGQDPFDIRMLAESLMAMGGSGFTGPAGADIALWDLIGKLTGQPLYKLWGGGRDKVPAYSSMLSLGTPQERADKAFQINQEGWQAIKYRCSFPTFKEDIQLIELTRKACGDDWVIMADGNKAGLTYTSGRGVPWDFTRAVQTAKAYQDLNVYFLEEPLPRYDFAAISELNRLVEMKVAGGEANTTVHEFRWLLEQGCYDVVQPEIMLDGPSRLRTIATLADSMGKYCIPHVGDMRLGTICDLHLVASWPNAPYIEVFNEIPIGSYKYPFSIFEEPLLLDKEGYLPVPQGPGLGVTIPEDMFENA